MDRPTNQLTRANSSSQTLVANRHQTLRTRKPNPCLKKEREKKREEHTIYIEVCKVFFFFFFRAWFFRKLYQLQPHRYPQTHQPHHNQTRHQQCLSSSGTLTTSKPCRNAVDRTARRVLSCLKSAATPTTSPRSVPTRPSTAITSSANRVGPGTMTRAKNPLAHTCVSPARMRGSRVLAKCTIWYGRTSGHSLCGGQRLSMRIGTRTSSAWRNTRNPARRN